MWDRNTLLLQAAAGVLQAPTNTRILLGEQRSRQKKQQEQCRNSTKRDGGIFHMTSMRSLSFRSSVLGPADWPYKVGSFSAPSIEATVQQGRKSGNRSKSNPCLTAQPAGTKTLRGISEQRA